MKMTNKTNNQIYLSPDQDGWPVTKEDMALFGLVVLGRNFREKPLGSILYKKDEKSQVAISTDGLSNVYDPSSKINKDKVSGIGSITKQFTSATLLKLWDNEITKSKQFNSSDLLKPEGNDQKKWFPEGLDSKLAGFMSELKDFYPTCKELFTRIESDKNYQDITLRDLLNHTHGLGARNDKEALKLVINSNPNPLAFSAISKITEKRKDEVYGKHQYGNFGYDLVGMIIEIVAKNTGVLGPEVPMDGDAFDTALYNLVLKPNSLCNTYTQLLTKESYEKDPLKFAIGYAIVKYVKDSKKNDEECQKAFNLISNTRAAGGMKSTVEDLAKFAPLFMDAKMFVNEEVKNEVFLGRGAEYKKNNPYHLAIKEVMKNMIGHDGSELTYESNLGFDPETGRTIVQLKLTENLIDYVAREIIKQIYPDDYKEMMKIREGSNFRSKIYSGELDPEDDNQYIDFMKYFIKGIKEKPVPEGKIGILALVEKYIETKEKIAEIPMNDLSKERDEIISNMVSEMKKKPLLRLEGSHAQKIDISKGGDRV